MSIHRDGDVVALNRSFKALHRLFELKEIGWAKIQIRFEQRRPVAWSVDAAAIGRVASVALLTAMRRKGPRPISPKRTGPRAAHLQVSDLGRREVTLLLRLFLLVAFALLPAIAVQSYNEFDLRRSRQMDVQEQVLGLAKLAAAEQ